MYFHIPPKLLAPFYTTFTVQSLWTINFRFFHALFSPKELKRRFLSSSCIQTYRHTCTDTKNHINMPPPNPEHPLAQKQCNYD